MAWPTLTDPYLRAAFWIGVGAVALIIALVLQIVSLRLDLRARERRTAATVARWRPVLTAALAGLQPDPIPQLRRSEEIDFIKLWLHFQASLRGEARATLNQVACAAGADQAALRMLRQSGRGEKLLAVLALGHLGERKAFETLQGLVQSDDRLLSMHASLALSQIDPQLTARDMVPVLITDSTWPVREVVTVLQESRAACEPVLKAMLPASAAQHLPRLLQVIEGLRIALPAAELAVLLRHDAVDVLISALRIAADPALREPVLTLTGHPDWRVRMHAAKTLGRIAQAGDVPVLTALLSDREWWVRYRTAQTLAALPFVRAGQLKAIGEQAADRFAADIVRQVRAEMASAP